MSKLLLLILCFLNGTMLGSVLGDLTFNIEFKAWYAFYSVISTFWVAWLLQRIDELENKEGEKDDSRGVLLSW